MDQCVVLREKVLTFYSHTSTSESDVQWHIRRMTHFCLLLETKENKVHDGSLMMMTNTCC